MNPSRLVLGSLAAATLAQHGDDELVDTHVRPAEPEPYRPKTASPTFRDVVTQAQRDAQILAFVESLGPGKYSTYDLYKTFCNDAEYSFVIDLLGMNRALGRLANLGYLDRTDWFNAPTHKTHSEDVFWRRTAKAIGEDDVCCRLVEGSVYSGIDCPGCPE